MPGVPEGTDRRTVLAMLGAATTAGCGLPASPLGDADGPGGSASTATDASDRSMGAAAERRPSFYPPGTTPWASFQGSAANTGVSPAVGPGATAGVRFTFEQGHAVSPPAIADGRVFVGRDDGTVVARRTVDGKRRWTAETSGDVRSTPVVDDGVVYVGTMDDYLYALDAASGEVLWRTETPGAVRAAPTVEDGTVYVGSGMAMAAYAAAGGEQRWASDVGETPQAAAVHDGTVYYAGIGRHVHAFDAANGERVWQYSIRTGGSFTPAAVVDAPGEVDAGPLVVFGDATYGDARVYALDGRDGSEVWTVSRDGYVRGSPAVDGTTVYVADRGRVVSALDLATGGERWTSPVDGNVETAPAVSASAVHVVDVHGRVYSFDRDSGERRWTHEVEGPRWSSLAVTDHTVFVPTDSGLLALG